MEGKGEGQVSPGGIIYAPRNTAEWAGGMKYHHKGTCLDRKQFAGNKVNTDQNKDQNYNSGDAFGSVALRQQLIFA